MLAQVLRAGRGEAQVRIVKRFTQTKEGSFPDRSSTTEQPPSRDETWRVIVSAFAPISHRFAQISPTDCSVVDTRNVPHQDGALERHFSIKEIAELWGLCENSVRELFKQEPGVVRIQRPKSRYKRAYTTIRIPRSVLERVHRRMSFVA